MPTVVLIAALVIGVNRRTERIAHAEWGLGLEVRAGVHTGEVELGPEGVVGIAVHIGARVSGLASAGEVLVSRTVRDLVVGSDLVFNDRGLQTLKGVPEPWQVYEVAGSTR